MEKKMIVKLNNSFYEREAIEEAITDFNELCEGKILNDNFEVELTAKEDIKNLKEEFSNYVLGLLKNKGLV